MSAIIDVRRSAAASEVPAPAQLLLHVEAAERSQVPIAITRGDSHLIYFANSAFARFFATTSQQLEGQSLEALTREPERMDALLQRAWRNHVAELAPDLAYVGTQGETLFGTTLVQPIIGLEQPASIVQVIDTTLVAQRGNAAFAGALELKQANEQLLLASLREHDLADRAAASAREIERLLHRKSVLADASTVLSASLDLERTVNLVARLAVPELSDCCLVQLRIDGAADRIALAHTDREIERRLTEAGDLLRRDADLAGLTALVVRTRTVSLLPELTLTADSSSAPGAGPFTLRELGARAALAIPLLAREQVIGVMVLLACSETARFEAADREFAVDLARRGSIAIDNARLYSEAKQAARMRENVLAIVSHDLRNPLAAISMCADRLLKYVPAEDPHELGPSYALIQRGSRHMRRMIEELLEVASIQSGQLQLEYSDVDLSDLLTEALQMLQPVAREKGVSLEREQIDPVLTLRCDREKALRVVANLLGNAVKFTPREGRVTLAASCDADTLRVDVADTGPGIPHTEQSKLFEQYWKGTLTGRTGMGLGLYIARGIVEAHGGRIWVERSSAEGSTFSFTLPAGGPVRGDVRHVG